MTLAGLWLDIPCPQMSESAHLPILDQARLNELRLELHSLQDAAQVLLALFVALTPRLD